jgi:hypothetical protein
MHNKKAIAVIAILPFSINRITDIRADMAIPQYIAYLSSLGDNSREQKVKVMANRNTPFGIYVPKKTLVKK